MLLPALPRLLPVAHAWPLWPPLLATRGPGSRSNLHRHHAMHFVLRMTGILRARASARGPWIRAAGVLTAPDVEHQIDAVGGDVLIVFLDPESEAGATLKAGLAVPLRPIAQAERDRIVADPDADPRSLLGAAGDGWIRKVAHILGSSSIERRRRVHPCIRKALRLLSASPDQSQTSLETLAKSVGLSAGRFMHVFTSSIGIPLRPYLAWLRLQRAAGAIVTGTSLTQAAHAAGFADAAHMTRTFRRAFGLPPSRLRPPRRRKMQQPQRQPG